MVHIPYWYHSRIWYMATILWSIWSLRKRPYQNIFGNHSQASSWTTCMSRILNSTQSTAEVKRSSIPEPYSELYAVDSRSKKILHTWTSKVTKIMDLIPKITGDVVRCFGSLEVQVLRAEFPFMAFQPHPRNAFPVACATADWIAALKADAKRVRAQSSAMLMFCKA